MSPAATSTPELAADPSAEGVAAPEPTLEESVAELLDEMDEASARNDEVLAAEVEREQPGLSEADPGPVVDDAPEAAGELERSIDAALEQAQASVDQLEEISGPAQEKVEAESSNSAEAAEEPAAVEAAAELEAEPPAPASTQELDESLSASAAEKLDEPLASEAPAEIAPVEESGSGVAAAEASAAEPVQAVESSSSVAAASSVDASEAIVASSTSPTISGTTAAQASPASARGLLILGPVAGAVRRVLAWPLDQCSAPTREIIGWFALVTLFNAACVWLYVFMR